MRSSLKKRNSISKNILVASISLAMCFSVIPIWSFAEEEQEETVTESVQVQDVQENISEETPGDTLQEEAAEETTADVTDEQEATVSIKSDDEEQPTEDPTEEPTEEPEEEPEVIIKDYGKPSGNLLENTSKYRKSMRIYGIYLHRANGSKVRSDRYGDAVLIESNGKYLLMDTGAIEPRKNSSAVYHSTIVSTLKKIGVKELDVYISHLHSDHTGGLDDICSNFKVNRLYLPDLELCKNYYTPKGYSIESGYVYNLDIAEGRIGELIFLKPSFRNHKDIVVEDKKENTQTVYGPNARRTNTFSVGAAVFTVIGPIGEYTVNQFKRQHGNCGSKNGHCLNNCSLTTIVQCGNFRFLSPGDTEKQEETKQVARYGSSLNCDMLKVSHHALSTSSKTNYLNCCTPIWSFEEDHGYSSSISAQVKRLRNYGYNYAVAKHKATLIVDVNNSKVRLIKDMNNNGRADEKAMSGWVSVQGSKKRYQYYTPGGLIRTGWIWKDKSLYYLNPVNGFRLTGKAKINGKKVEFDENGKLISHKRPARVKMKSAKALKKHKARIKWTKTKGASAYQVYRSNKKKSGYVRIRTVSKKRLSIKNKKLKRGKTYYYKVRAVRYVAGGKMYGAFSKPMKIVAR